MPNLKVLSRIAGLILGGSFPGTQVRAAGGETELKDIGKIYCGQGTAGRCIDYTDALVRRPGEISATRRINTASQIPFWLNEIL